MLRKIWIVAIFALVATSTAVLAPTSITTSVRFLLPSSTAFAISTPSTNATFNTGSTPTVFFNSTTTTITMINASLSDVGTATQDNSTAIFRYRNDGNKALNITLSFGTISSTCINVKASVGSLGWQSTCSNVTTITTNTTCTNWNSTSVIAKNVTNDLATNAVRDVWLWADYSSCATGLDETQTLTHTAG